MVDNVADIAAMRCLHEVMTSTSAPPKNWTSIHSVLLEVALSNGDTAMVSRLTDELKISAKPPQKHLVQILTNIRRSIRQLFNQLDYISITQRLLHHFGTVRNLPRRQK